MNARIAVVVLVAALVGWSSLAAQAEPRRGNLRALRGEQIQAALSSRVMGREDSYAPGVEHRLEEYFCPPDRYQVSGGDTGWGGRYQVDGDQFCVPLGGATICRRLYRDRRGRFYVQNVSSNETPPMQMRLRDANCN